MSRIARDRTADAPCPEHLPLKEETTVQARLPIILLWLTTPRLSTITFEEQDRAFNKLPCEVLDPGPLRARPGTRKLPRPNPSTSSTPQPRSLPFKLKRHLQVAPREKIRPKGILPVLPREKTCTPPICLERRVLKLLAPTTLRWQTKLTPLLTHATQRVGTSAEPRVPVRVPKLVARTRFTDGPTEKHGLQNRTTSLRLPWTIRVLPRTGKLQGVTSRPRC